jgi:S1-C subfamily serine protease
MNDHNDGLWQGGSWERSDCPLPELPAVHIPEGPVRPARKRPRLRRRRWKWPWFAGLLSLIVVLCLSAALLERYFMGQAILRHWDRDGMPSVGEEQPQDEKLDDTPPAIPQAETGTGVTVELQPAQGAVLPYTQIYDRAILSAVSIQASTGRGYGSAGSGVVLTEDGYIITNAHVVAGAQEVKVMFHDNRTLPASLVGFHAVEDLAVLKVEASGLTPAQFGDSSVLHIGEPVAALGDSLGYRATFTDGIVSSLDREVEVEGVTMSLIQTTAAINYGNSGGPLLNQYGQVVGINTIKIVTEDGSAEGLGFAIPSRRVKYVADHLIAGEEIKTGRFGFSVNRIPVVGGGLELLIVEEDSDAWAKGLRAGDILLEADGAPIAGFEDLTRLKLGLGPGDGVSFLCERDGEQFTVEVELIEA